MLSGRLVAVPPSPPASSWQPGDKGDAMGEAIALIVESMRADGGDLTVLNAVLGDVPPERVPVVAMAAVILATHLGQHWADHEPAGPAELLACIGLAAADRSGVA